MRADLAKWGIPKTWSWAHFRDVAVILQNLVSPEDVPNAPHIAPNNIESGTRVLLPYKTVRDDGVISPKNRFFKGQIIFSKIRPYLLKSTLVDFDGVCSADMYPIQTKVNMDRNYLLYWLTSPDFRDEIAHNQGRTVLPKINQSELGCSRLPLPPVSEQHRIVAKIDRLAARSRRAREELEATRILGIRAKKSILEAAFTGSITRDLRSSDALTGWRELQLHEIADIQTGITLGKMRNSNDVLVERPYLRVANVQRGWIDTRDIKHIKVTESEYERLRLLPGDILMNEGGDRDKLGRGWVWYGQISDCIHQNHVFRVRLRDHEYPSELISLFANEFGQKHFIDQGKQTTNLASISKAKLATLPLLLPPNDEANELLRRIERAFAAIDRLATEARSARNALDKLDQAILAKAFRGELVPHDPNDEPASVLLERIRAERAADGPAPKRGRRPRGAAA